MRVIITLYNDSVQAVRAILDSEIANTWIRSVYHVEDPDKFNEDAKKVFGDEGLMYLDKRVARLAVDKIWDFWELGPETFRAIDAQLQALLITFQEMAVTKQAGVFIVEVKRE